MIVYLICYAASFLFGRMGIYWLSGLALIMAALYLYFKDYSRTKNMIHLRGLFSLFWVGGQGVACLKLSHLQTDWSLMTWGSFLGAFLGFYLTFALMSRFFGHAEEERVSRQDFEGRGRSIFLAMAVLTAVSVTAFVFEAVVLGYVPFFLRGVPHAYSEFHISGIHYLTVSCVLIPPLSVIYYQIERGRAGGRRLAAFFMDIAALSIPILCVSRFQLILAVGLSVLTYIAMQKRFHIGYALGLAAVMIPAYLILTVARSHDVSYLNGIFEMKNSSMPIFVTQPYMYIANNYDNFNCLVEQLPSYAMGYRMLFPVWALTGLKFLYPSLVAFPLYRTKEELTTVTLFYDAYYDFGIIGVVVFSCILGAVAYVLLRKIQRTRNPVGYLFYAQIAIYLVFSFFTTWFSNPATWFYLAVTAMVYFFCGRRGRFY